MPLQSHREAGFKVGFHGRPHKRIIIGRNMGMAWLSGYRMGCIAKARA